MTPDALPTTTPCPPSFPTIRGGEAPGVVGSLLTGISGHSMKNATGPEAPRPSARGSFGWLLEGTWADVLGETPAQIMAKKLADGSMRPAVPARLREPERKSVRFSDWLKEAK